jgi:hypothetical protein
MSSKIRSDVQGRLICGKKLKLRAAKRRVLNFFVLTGY